jgi:pimeloyl-ACP methyl ester carboxylesterase
VRLTGVVSIRWWRAYEDLMPRVLLIPLSAAALCAGCSASLFRLPPSFVHRHRRTVILLLMLVVPLHAQQPADWKDPSSHVKRFVMVSDNVQLEVLDWGGSGRPLVLLPGGGNTAHVFDEFTSKLTADFHVYGITRRGFGESAFAAPTSGADTYGDDVLAVLDALKLARPVLVGHSIGGQELSSVATRYPTRVAALVYLDAGYPYAFDNGKGPTMKEFEDLRVPQLPPPTEADLASFATLRQYLLRVQGFTFPEAELRQQRPVSPDGRVGEPRDFPGCYRSDTPRPWKPAWGGDSFLAITRRQQHGARMRARHRIRVSCLISYVYAKADAPRGIFEIGLGERPNDEPAGHSRLVTVVELLA